MLSIGKMVARSEEYYIATVANGREEYYTGSGESVTCSTVCLIAV